MKNILFLAVAFIAGAYFGKPLIDKIIKPKPSTPTASTDELMPMEK